MNNNHDISNSDDRSNSLGPKQYAVIAGIIIIFIVFLILILPKLSTMVGNYSPMLTFFIYLLMGLSSAVLLHGAMVSYGRIKGKRFGVAFEFGGPAALVIAVVFAGLYYHSFNDDNYFGFSIYFYENESRDEIAKVNGNISLHLDSPKTFSVKKGYSQLNGIPKDFERREVTFDLNLDGFVLSETTRILKLHPREQFKMYVKSAISTPENNIKPPMFDTEDRTIFIAKIESLLTPPFMTHETRFTHGPSDCVHHAVETLRVRSFTVDEIGFSCSYSINKYNTGRCRGLPFEEQRPVFYGQVTGRYEINENRLKVIDLEDIYPSNLEQSTKGGTAIKEFLLSRNSAVIPQ